MGLFVLPLAMLRWVWWRLNIWVEIVGLVVGLPLAYLVWFVWGFKDDPYWMSFGMLFLSGMGAVVLGALLTRPEPMEVLVDFYRTVRPPGFWGPVREQLDPQERSRFKEEWRADLTSAIAGLVFCAGLTVGTSACVTARWGWFAAALLTLVGAGGAFWRAIRRGDGVRAA
jgi:hypothetical protein